MKHVLSEAEGTVRGFRRTRYRGLDRTGLAAPIKIGVVATAYNLVRMAKLLGLARKAPETKVA